MERTPTTTFPQRRHWLIGAGLLGLSGAGAFALWPQKPVSVRIGVGQPLSGPLAALGKDMLQGAQLAAEHINRDGGVRIGTQRLPIEILSADDRAEPQAGVAAAQSLVGQQVLAAIAHLNSGVSMAAAPVYAQAGVVQLAISTKPEYTQLGLPTTLRLVANDDMQALALAQFARQKLGAKRIATLHDGTPYGKGLIEAVSRSLIRSGSGPVAQQVVDDKGTEFGAAVRELAQAKPDLLITTVADFQVEALLPQLNAAGLPELPVLGSDTLKTPRLGKAEVGSRALYASTPIVSAQEFLGGKDFLLQFRERFGGEPYYAAHYAFDAIHLVAEALSRNGSLDRTKLLERLKTFEGHAPVTSLMRMGEDGEQRSGAVGIYTLSKGQWELSVRSGNW
ncbi:branched-chain amino acid transport system substrate-binding protein [Inhella inkyongensis]|uniref:Branched-chain amino acid transport system substrate-binding protein n=1 Tax=Inhella inkyongensis TaxID=392593 RepID=A0A840SCI9_9BURK|nr:branched-chain amino acid ABC transporter substrate-binding protein [Inhella inkyongensis]MBB5206060.1 branched-chain amino acid transport system substrate-binding protein [Inhella inkyongensis]